MKSPDVPSPKLLAAVLPNLEGLFSLRIQSAELAPRADQDPVINAYLREHDGREFFLKEIQPHSLRDGMDAVYEQLSSVRSGMFRLLLPIAHDKGRYLFTDGQRTFALLRRERLHAFQAGLLPYEDLLSALQAFHDQIAGFTFPAQSYRTFASWLQRGVDKVGERYGEDAPLIPEFRRFLRDRYPQLALAAGNIHWDVHAQNFCFDEFGKLVILDFDLVQRGEYACDFSRA